MQELSEYTKRHWDVVVIGGGRRDVSAIYNRQE